MTDDLERRLDAVERAITGGDRSVADLADAGEITERVERVDERAEDLERRLADLEAAVRALRGYLGHLAEDGPTETPDGGEAPAPERQLTGETNGTGGEETPDWDWNWTDGDDTAPEGSTGDGPARGDDAGTDRGVAPESDRESEPGAVDEQAATADRRSGSGRRLALGDDGWESTAPTPPAGESRRPDAPERPDSTGGHQPGRRADGARRSADGGRYEHPADNGEREPPVGNGEREASVDQGEGEPSVDRGERERPAEPAPRPPDATDDPADRADWRPESGPAGRWPGDTDEVDTVDDRRRGTAEPWHGGMDVDRAQPWAVPDPPTVDCEDDEDGLLDRVREAF